MSYDQMVYDNQKKTALITFLLWLFFGIFGGHRFYLGKIGTGILMLITLGGLGVWTFIDLFLIWGMVRTYNQNIIDGMKLSHLDGNRS